MKKDWRGKLAKWGDECKLALVGTGTLLKKWKYLVIFLVIALVFGMVMTFLNSGFAELKLLFADISLVEKFNIKLMILGRMFGVGGMDFSKILVLIIAILQGISISLLIFVSKSKKKMARKKRLSETEGVGASAVLALLGTGCSSCGVSLVAPIASALFSSSGYLLANVTSWLFTLGALVLSFLTMKRLGFDSYAIQASERRAKNVGKN